LQKLFAAVGLAFLTILAGYGWRPKLFGVRRLLAKLGRLDTRGKELCVVPETRAFHRREKIAAAADRPLLARNRPAHQPAQP